MASTRYTQQPLQIYQDPVTSFDHAPMPSIPNSLRPDHATSHAPKPLQPKKLSPLRPIKNAASRRNIVLNPPQEGPRKHSPLKLTQQTSSSPSRAPFSGKLNTVTMPPPGPPGQQTDSIEKKQPLMSKFKPQKALFMTFPSTRSADVENISHDKHSNPYGSGFDGSNFSLEGLYGQKRSSKRTLLEAAPIQELRPLKKLKPDVGQEREDFQDEQGLPTPDLFPPHHDDGTKPAHSYAQLIGMSILRAPSRRLTLAQIYKWISDNYSFYNPADAGWQNSIRHNLSLNKAFIKQERPKDDPGKGNYWVIQPGMEHQFTKDKFAKRPAGESVPLLATNLAPVAHPDSLQPSFKSLAPARRDVSLPPQSTLPEGPLSTIPELSSDATIPASDSFMPEEGEGQADELPPSSPLIQSSPPAAVMHSSPPVPRHVPRRQATPPPVPPFPSSSRTRSHKRKFASMDDSGYFSSLDSSAKRPHQVGQPLTSEADRPRIKRGRAEEELARLRGSSYDSPSRSRAALSGFGPPSSSPLRRSQKHGSSQMLPPLTPAVKLRPPVRPPQSVSPNTNLRLHRDRVREMVGSPVRDMACLDENMPPWSPIFNYTDETPFIFSSLENDADIFTDLELQLGWNARSDKGSPEKRSAKRPRLDRPRSTNALSDISNGNGSKSVTPTPMLRFTPNLAPSAFNSPSRGLGVSASPNKLFGFDSPTRMGPATFDPSTFDLLQDGDFCGAEFLSEEATDFSGMDIMQGFQKIGARVPAARSTPKGHSSRPSLGRSFTSQF